MVKYFLSESFFDSFCRFKQTNSEIWMFLSNTATMYIHRSDNKYVRRKKTASMNARFDCSYLVIRFKHKKLKRIIFCFHKYFYTVNNLYFLFHKKYWTHCLDFKTWLNSINTGFSFLPYFCPMNQKI